VAELRVISLFSGAGGIDYGLEAAGFKTSVAVEVDPDCCETLRLNRPWPVLERDIVGLSPDEILAAGRLRRGQAALLVGGPPCQPFSKASFWRGGESKRLLDPRAATLDAYLRVLEHALPQAFLLENVEGLSYRGKDEGLQHILESVEKINRRTKARYKTSLKVINSAGYGVPQSRRRLIIVGIQENASFEFPQETHSEDSGELLRFTTAWDAIGDLTADETEGLAVTGRWGDLLPSIPEGHNYLWHTAEMGNKAIFGWRTRYWSFLLKLAKTKPSWTISASPGPGTGPFHWNNRRLSVREMCRLQTFPDSIQLAGSRLSMQRQVGNAVPSLLAEVLGRSLRTQVFGGRRRSAPLQLLPPDRGPAPPPERPRTAPKRFASMIRDRAPHPGTGLGPGARARIVVRTPG
jgi:DNA (cytosine-5)-methyltransferase 1